MYPPNLSFKSSSYIDFNCHNFILTYRNHTDRNKTKLLTILDLNIITLFDTFNIAQILGYEKTKNHK